MRHRKASPTPSGRRSSPTSSIQTGGPSDPEVVSAEAVTWNDGSLGCPEAGQAYTQALVDGYQVILEVDGERYDYRVGSGASVKLCEGGPLEGG